MIVRFSLRLTTVKLYILYDMKHITRIRKICKEIEKVENFELAYKDNFKNWILHHRLELSLDNEEVHTPETLKRLDMYYDRPYFELIFMKRNEHIALHNSGRKGKFTEERRKKISDSVKRAYEEGRLDTKGEKNGMYGKDPWNKKKRES